MAWYFWLAPRENVSWLNPPGSSYSTCSCTVPEHYLYSTCTCTLPVPVQYLYYSSSVPVLFCSVLFCSILFCTLVPSYGRLTRQTKHDTLRPGKYSTVQYSTAQYSTAQYSTVQYSTQHGSAVQHVYEDLQAIANMETSVRTVCATCWLSCSTMHTAHYILFTMHCIL